MVDPLDNPVPGGFSAGLGRPDPAEFFHTETTMPAVEHRIHKTTTPISVTARCTCGWAHRETRRQNAFARAAKLKAAISKHLSSVPSQLRLL